MTKPETVAKTEQLAQETAESQNDTNLTESDAAATTDATEEAHEDTQARSTNDEATVENASDAAAEADADVAATTEARSNEGEVEKSADATKDDAQAAATSTTEGQEVAKSAVFGDWAEIGVATEAISQLSWTLQDYVWMVLSDTDKSADEKVGAVDAGLQDFRTLTLKVVTALVQEGNTDALKSAAEAFKANAPDAVAKSLTDKDTKVEELTKSLATKDEELTKAQKSLEETTKKLETIEARKSLAFQSGAKSAVFVDENDTTQKSSPSIGELYLKKLGAIPESTTQS